MAITHTSALITLSGSETGDNLRNYITTNSLGTVTGRSAIVNRSITQANASVEFTDNDCTWIFSGSYHFDFTATINKFEIIDGVIIYTDAAKSHSTQIQANTVKFNNVQYRIEDGTGRTDFFSNQRSGFEFANVQFISYGGANVLHLATNGGSLENVSVEVGSGTLNFQPDCQSGQELVMRNWTLGAGVGAINPNGGQDRTAVTRLENLNWKNTNWNFGWMGRGQTYLIVNPIKPAGWTGLTTNLGSGTQLYSDGMVKELHTHNVNTVKAGGIPIENYRIQLRRADLTTIVYDELTDPSGNIVEQEVITIEREDTTDNFLSYGDFELRGYLYGYAYTSAIRSLQNGRIDESITALVDSSVTDTKAVVDAMPFSVSVIGNTLTVTGDPGSIRTVTANNLYDAVCSYLQDNFGIEDIRVLRADDVINAGDYTVNLNNVNFIGKLITTDVVTLNNSTTSQPYIDSTQDSSLVESNGAFFTIYTSEADRDNRTNPLVTNINSYSFVFNSLVANPLYLWVLSGATELPTEITLTQGTNTFDLGTAGVLNSLSNLVKYIPSKMYVDVDAIINGTGTVIAPYNATIEAINNTNIVGTKTIVLMANTVLAQSINGFRIEGSPSAASVNLNNQDVNDSIFAGIEVTGSALQGSEWNAHNCTLNGTKNLNGKYTTCFMEGTITTEDNSEIHMTDISSSVAGNGRPIIDLTGKVNVKLDIRDYKGGITIIGCENAGNEITISGTECKITLDPTCTDGFISVRGIAQLSDNSAGATVDTTALNNPEKIGMAVGQIITNVDVPTSTRLASADYSSGGSSISVADIEASTILAKTTDITSLNDLSLSDVEGSTILAKEATLNSIINTLSNIPTTDSVADLTPVLSAIMALNDITAIEVRNAFDEVEFKDKNTEVEIHTWLDSYSNKNDYKTDTTGLATTQNITDSESNVLASIDDNTTLINSIITSLNNTSCPTKEDIRDCLLLVKDQFKADLTTLNDVALQDIIDGIELDIKVIDLKNHITAMNFAS